MRLIDANTLRLCDFNNASAPPYAVLSHTWSVNGEVCYQDMLLGIEPATTEIAAWQKIRACCRTAKQDGISYVWIDSCCIDKSNSSEVSEAINSMFSWYAGASICYAYLEDVASSNAGIAEKEFRGSRWFRRGWTLQELLAPECIRFYSRSWTPLGSRHDLAWLIREATSIPVEVLVEQGSDFRDCSVAQKMSWAANRDTTKEEDMAYCLLGIFGVNMSPVYGEGGTEAFRRLQEEIMKGYDDETIFCWTQPDEYGLTSISALAPSPRHFANCANIRCSKLSFSKTPFEVTNNGINIRIPLREINGRTYGVFRCQLGCDPTRLLAVPLERISDTTNFVRLPGNMMEVGPRVLKSQHATNIYLAIRVRRYHSGLNGFEAYTTIVLAKLSRHCALVDVSPKSHVDCDPARRTIRMTSLLSPNKVWIRVQSRPGRDFIFAIHPQLYGDEFQRKYRLEVAYAIPRPMLKLNLDTIVEGLDRGVVNCTEEDGARILATHIVRVRPMFINSENILWVDGMIQHTWVQAVASGKRVVLCSLL